MRATYKGNLFALFALIFSTLIIHIAIDVFGRESFEGFYPKFLLSFMAYAVPVIVFFIISKDVMRKDVLSLKALPLRDILCLCTIGLFIQPLLLIVSALSSLISPNNVPAAIQSYSTVSFWQTFAIIAFLPGIMEEIIFRGIILSNYKNVPFKQTAVVTGFIFAMAHSDLQQFPYTFIMGMLFVFLVHRSGSILASIVPHMIINAVQSLIGYSAFASAPTRLVSITADTLTYILTSPVGMLFSVTIFCFAISIFNRTYPAKVTEIHEQDNPINLPLIAIIGYYIFTVMFI